MTTDVRMLPQLYQIGEVELAHVRALGETVSAKLVAIIDDLYRWLPKLPEFARMFGSPEKVARDKAVQLRYWADFFQGNVDEGYIERRRRLGVVHANVGLSLNSYFASMNMMVILITEAAKAEGYPATMLGDAVDGLTRLANFDAAVVAEAFSRNIQQKLVEQSEAILQMSTPIATIWEGILLVPIVGLIDSRRAQDIMRTVLQRIRETEAQVCILDIAGVAVVDTAVANHFTKVTRATRLMGCECIVSGLSPAVTETIVSLGVDVASMTTKATLKDALKTAFKLTDATAGSTPR